MSILSILSTFPNSVGRVSYVDFQTANHGKEKVLMAFRTVREMIHSSVR